MGGPTGTGDSTGESMGDSIGEPTGEPDEPIDQFYSSCNQKKPLIDFCCFLTCNIYRQRN
jgi:hypothetical protein